MTENIQDIDLIRLHELMDEYQVTTDPQERREIENEVLAETVWKTGGESCLIAKTDLQKVLQSVDEEDKVANRILRRSLIQNL